LLLGAPRLAVAICATELLSWSCVAAVLPIPSLLPFIILIGMTVFNIAPTVVLLGIKPRLSPNTMRAAIAVYNTASVRLGLNSKYILTIRIIVTVQHDSLKYLETKSVKFVSHFE
jgi:hypothetical protein